MILAQKHGLPETTLCHEKKEEDINKIEFRLYLFLCIELSALRKLVIFFRFVDACWRHPHRFLSCSLFALGLLCEHGRTYHFIICMIQWLIIDNMCLIRCVRARIRFDKTKAQTIEREAFLAKRMPPSPNFIFHFNLDWALVDFLWPFFFEFLSTAARLLVFFFAIWVWPPHIEMFVLRVRDLIQIDQNKNVHTVFLCNQFYLNLIMRIARARHSCSGGHFHAIQMLFLFSLFASTVAEGPIRIFLTQPTNE